MQLLLVSVCLAIFSSAIASASKPYYVITVPAISVQGAQQKACVTFQDLEGTVNLKLELHKDEKSEVVAEQKIDTAHYSNCFSFQAPVSEETKSVWLFHVSAHGDHLNINETKKILIIKAFGQCSIQTDREIYKPGDTVMFRLISVDWDFRANNKKYPLVYLTDPGGIRVGQWKDVTPDHGIADFSFPLPDELALGQYKIIIPDECDKYFFVSEYEKKRFELTINAPESVGWTTKSFHLDVCGSYIYGKPVEGFIDLSICPVKKWRYQRHDSSSEEAEDEEKPLCTKIDHVKTDAKGCLSREIDLSSFKLSTVEHDTLKIDTSITENDTGKTEKQSHGIYLEYQKQIKFLDAGDFFFKDVPYKGKVHVVDGKNEPLANEDITVYSSEEDDVKIVTDKNGEAHFALNTSNWDIFKEIVAMFSSDFKSEEESHSKTSHYVSQFFSVSNSFVTVESSTKDIPCDSDLSLTVEYDINNKILDANHNQLTFVYFVLSKHEFILYKEHAVDIIPDASSPNLHGSFQIKFHTDGNLFPGFFVFVYSVLPNGETIVGRALYRATECIKNKVQLSFSEEQVNPGDNVNLKVTAEPGSLCSVRSVDKGLLLQHPHHHSSVLSGFSDEFHSMFYFSNFQRLLYDPEPSECPGDEGEGFRYDWFILDAFSLFQASNIKVFTNTRIRLPNPCEEQEVIGRSSLKRKQHKEKSQLQKKPRSYFPDTWLYKLVPVGPEGHTVLNLTTPDTITKWETDAFCLGKSGLAEIKDVQFTTFQPYFIELIIPYSVVQGEEFTIQALVFSYEKKCILVVASLSDSEDFKTAEAKEKAKCVCEGHSTYFTWDATGLKPKKNVTIHVESGSLAVDGECTEDTLLLGKDQRHDAIEKTIIIKPKGYEDEETETFLLYPADDIQKVHVSLVIPDRFVHGSERAHIIVLGDLMSNIIMNLDDILELPDGCGEQNIAKFIRTIYTTKYLQGVNELTTENLKKIEEPLIKGFLKALTFKGENGSYAFFSDDEPNFWITALVVKAFTHAQDYICIDETEIQKSVDWLQKQQLPNGCFKDAGDYFNNELDADDEVAQAAYVIISLLEHGTVFNGSVVENALTCIKHEIHNITSVYTQALLAYAFTLAGESELRQEILQRLDKVAVKKEGSKHWETDSYSKGEVETAAYVILALLSAKTIDPKDLKESADIVRWLITEQNPQGGFRSSQDTTVAIYALSKFAKATYSKKGDTTVTIDSASGFHKEIHVDKANTGLLQRVDLPEFPGEYTVTASGNGCVYIQSHLHYYRLPEKSETHFALNVSTQPLICNHDGHSKFELHVDARYTGKRKETNMVVITAEFPSGYFTERVDLKKINAKKTEVHDGKINIYWDEFTHETKSFTITLTEEIHVKNLQPANVVIYDYYDPDEYTVAEYNSPCIGVKSHCKVGVSERKDCGHPKITSEQCQQKGCCFDDSIPESKWCFLQGFEKEESH